MLAASLAASMADGAALRAAPPTITPPSPDRDTTVPFEPPQTVLRGNQTIQVQSIRRTLTTDGHEAVADRIIVAFRPGVTPAEQDVVHQEVAAREAIHAIPLKQVGSRAYYIDVTGAPSLEAAIQTYRADPRVAYAEPDILLHTAETPNDPLFGSQYGMTKINAPAAWNITHGSPNVKIAILDCGIYEAHPDLVGKVTARQDFTGNPYGSGTDDRCNHGTHVAGIAAARTNDGTGVAGVGYNTSLLNGKVMLEQYDQYGNLIPGAAIAPTTWVVAGIQWAADSGANVISMSLGQAYPCEQVFQDAINYAWARNVVVVAAAGNHGLNEPFEPAGCAHTIAVASTDASDAKSSFSNYGPWVPVAAPGSAILSSVNPNLNNGSLYATKSGTSMATPHVAGLAALLWASTWGASAQAVVTHLETTVAPIAGTGTYWLYGRIDAAAALAPPPPPPPAQHPAARPQPTIPAGSATTSPAPRPSGIAPASSGPTPAPLPMHR